MLANVDLDIRKEVSLLQKEFSIDILYVRANKYIRCKCFNMLHQVGDPDCHICLGNGHITTIEKLSVITHGLQTQRPNAEIAITELGMAATPFLAFYFEYNMMPRVRDIIIFVGYNTFGQIQDVKKVCVVTAVDEIRGENGRIELYSVNATVRPELYKSVQRAINKLDDTAKADIARGVKYVWPLQK